MSPWRSVTTVVSVLTIMALAIFAARLSSGDTKMVDPQVKTVPLQTVCVGRFLVDIPSTMEFSYGGAEVYGWRISSDVSESDLQFGSRVLARERELAARKNERDLPSLELVQPVNDLAASGKVFVFDRQWTYHFENGKRIDHDGATLEALVRLDGVSYTFFLEIGDTKNVEEVLLLIGQLRSPKNDELPEKAGFCFGNGMILDPIPTAEPIESTVMFAGWREHPDINIALSTMSGVHNDTTLLQRDADSSTQAMYPSHFKKIFKGRREINGIPGEEVSERVKELNGTHGHSYMWESDTVKEADALRPFLTLELSTGVGRPGEPVNSSLPDKEVQALWDQISGSLRLRQVKPASPEEAPRADAKPEETSVRAGQSCPATGWWSCSADVEGHQVLGGATQHFTKGARMPQAQLLAPTSVLDKLKNHQPTFTLSTPTEWTLAKAQP